jgi:photosystem II stability/assembly factor-like uncharacterized protein
MAVESAAAEVMAHSMFLPQRHLAKKSWSPGEPGDAVVVDDGGAQMPQQAVEERPPLLMPS